MILGVDPGLLKTGLGLVSATGKDLSIKFSGLIRTKGTTVNSRLYSLGTDFEEFLDQWESIKACAVERVFFSQDKPGAMTLAHARGVLLYLVTKKKIPIYEYAATTIKKIVTMSGRATKESVRLSIERLMNLGQARVIKDKEDQKKGKKIPDDVYDALAIAITHKFRGNFSVHD